MTSETAHTTGHTTTGHTSTGHTSTGRLPAEPDAFVGRERELAELRRLLSQTTRAVTLCGPGGIGKTRLAVRLARAMAAEHPDGVYFVELAELPAGTPVACRVAAAFGLADEPGHGGLEALGEALRQCRTLLVLDNCEHLVTECARLCRALLARCDRLRILATSREPLRMPGETVWRVPPLSVPCPRDTADDLAPDRHEAVRLFVTRAQAARPDFAPTPGNAPALAELCRTLDGVPLALELAAARVRVLTVEQIVDRMGDRFGLLTSGDRTAPPRQRTLRGAIDWSHELLAEPERILLRRLSVFSGWTLESAERVCAGDLLPRESILDLLTALVDKSLVVVVGEVAGQSRFRLLESVRGYAARRLADAGERDELRDRHRAAVLEMLEREAEIGVGLRKASWRQRVELFDGYDAERHNLRAALAWCRERGDIDEGLRLCAAARHYWLPRGYYKEAAEWCDWFLARGDAACPHILGPALVGRAQLAIDQLDFAGAESHAQSGLKYCRAAGNARMTAAGLVTLAQVALHRGDHERALALADEAEAGAEGDCWHEAMSLFTKGLALLRRGNLREAEASVRSGIALMREADQLWGAALGQAVGGAVALRRGDLHGAHGHFEQALPALREIDARPVITRCLRGLGRCALAQGDLAGARRAFAESLRLTTSIGLRVGVARSLEVFAELLVREGDEAGAVLLGGAAGTLWEATGAGPARCGTRLDDVLERARSRLGKQRVAQLWGKGRAMPADRAVAYALEAASRPPIEETGTAVTPPGLLTPREREIALLIARGLSNRGIADELVISPATVARHVTNILGKLGFASRAQIAAWAVDNIPAGH